jgi:hypothetical protein
MPGARQRTPSVLLPSRLKIGLRQTTNPVRAELVKNQSSHRILKVPKKRVTPQPGLSAQLIAKKLSQDGSEAIRDCRTNDQFANADYNPKEKLVFSNKGGSRQNEEGNLAVGAALVEKLNLLGGKWSTPVDYNKEGADCLSKDGAKRLFIQITKISPSNYFRDLAACGRTSREQDVEPAVSEIMGAARKKAGRASPQIVLALDATDTPAYTMNVVIAALRSKHEAELRGFGWQAIWLVGAEPTLTAELA